MLRNYLKIAFKVFLRRKFFTFISLFGISFTLLVLMVAASLIDHIFAGHPPETRSDRSLGIFGMKMSGPHGTRTGPAGYKLLDEVVRPLSNVEAVSIHSSPETVSSYKDGERISLDLKRTDGEYWRILQFQFLEGGPITVEDERDARFVAVINQATRRRFFGESPAVGKTIEVDGQRFRIAGVVKNVPYFRNTAYADIWVPISTMKGDAYKRELMGSFMATILAKSRSDMPAIKEEVQARLARVEIPDKNFDKMEGVAETYFESFAREFFLVKGGKNGSVGMLIAVMIGAAVLFMVLPTLNLVNLNVSRIMERASEIGVRRAFGATRRTLVGQFVIENVVLSLVGGAIGFLLSLVALRILGGSGIIPYAEFHLNARIFLYALALAVFFGLFSGVLPAWKMSRLHPVEALRGRTR